MMRRLLLAPALLAACLFLAPIPAHGSPSCFGRPATQVGTNGDDRLVGTGAADVIFARGGDDEIFGRGGGDRICAGGGSDFVSAGAGNDKIDLGTGPDGVLPGSGDDVVDGGKGFNVLDYDTSNDIRADLRVGEIRGLGFDRVTDISALITGSGNDVLIGSDRHDDFLSGAGDDTLVGRGSNDLLGPGSGDDVVRGGRGGFDTVDFVFSDDTSSPVQIDLLAGTVAGQGSDTLTSIEGAGGTNGDDTLSGDDGSNVLYGWDGDDAISGGSGDDIITPGLGDDTADGGDNEPVDVASYRFGDVLDHRIINGLYQPTDVPVVVDLAAGTSMGLGSDTVTGFESAYGTDGDDSIALDDGPNGSIGFAGSDSIQGLDGNDYLDGDDVLGGVTYDGTDALDGGLGEDVCVAGETVTDCESTTPSTTPSMRAVRLPTHVWHALGQRA